MKMNPIYKKFAANILSRLNYTPINDSWINGVTHITLSKEDAKWIKSYNRVTKIESTLSQLTLMDLKLSIEKNRRVLEIRNKSDYVYRTTLKKDFHWKDEDIIRLYPKASLYRINKYYSSLPRTELYRLNLIHKFEQEDEQLRTRIQKYKTEEWKANVEKRKAAAQKALETRARNYEERLEKLNDEILNLEIGVEEYDDMDELIRDACSNYNDYSYERRRYDSYAPYVPFNSAKDDEFYKRITLNYLRHCCTNYDDLLDYYLSQVKEEDEFGITLLLKHSVNSSIRSVYDWL